MSGLDLSALLQSAPLPVGRHASITTALVLYFVAVAAIAVWASRRTHTASDFFVAGQRLGVVTMGVAAMAATVSGFAFIGGPGLMYSVGLGALYIVLPLSFTAVLGAWVLARRLRLLAEVRPVATIPEAIAARYRSPVAQGVAALAIVIATVGYLATNALALGYVLAAALEISLPSAIWLGSAITLAYSAAGGILAGVYTDLFQGLVMATASVLMCGLVLRLGEGVGGLSAAILAADPSFLAPSGTLSPLPALSLFYVFGLGTLGQPHVIHKFYMVREPRQLRWYPLVMTIAMSLTMLVFVSVGLGVKALVSAGALPPLARPDTAMPMLLTRFAPPALAGVVLAGVAAAIMSSVNSFLNVGAAALVRDLPNALGRPFSRELLWARVATVGLAVAATGVASWSGSAVAFLGIFGWGLFASTLVPALALGLNWRGATGAGATASIAIGLIVTLALETLSYTKVFTVPAGVTPAAIALTLSLGTMFAVSWFTRASAAAELDDDVAAVIDA